MLPSPYPSGWHPVTFLGCGAPIYPILPGARRRGISINPGPGWELRIDMDELTFLRVDHQARLQFGELEVVIESTRAPWPSFEVQLSASGWDSRHPQVYYQSAPDLRADLTTTREK